MYSKHRFPAAALLFLALVCQMCAAQVSKPAKPSAATPSSAGKPNAPTPASTESTTPSDVSPTTSPSGPSSSSTTNPACANGPCDYQQPHITIATAAPAPAPWSLQDRIKWLAIVLLVLVAYVGVILAVSALRKIERQSQFMETTAQAAADSVKVALMFAESHAKAARPWVLVTAEPSPGSTSSFSVVASNRGGTPARIVALAEGIALVADEAQLPTTPPYKSDPRAPLVPLILLPGESTTIKTFSREEMKSVCENSEQVQRVEDWEEKIYIFGNVAYVDLVASGGEAHATGWCCWYIHGRQKSGMVMAGPAEYNRHS